MCFSFRGAKNCSQIKATLRSFLFFFDMYYAEASPNAHGELGINCVGPRRSGTENLSITGDNIKISHLLLLLYIKSAVLSIGNRFWRRVPSHPLARELSQRESL